MSHQWHLCARDKLLIAGLAAFGLLATIAPAGATTLRRMDLPELVSTADRIVDARAVASTVYWDPDGTQIYTDTTFEVLAEAKGIGPSTLTVTLLGGEIGEIELRAEGSPIFSLGDEVVLFTLDRSDGKSDLVGYTQGVMRVLTESTTSATGESVPVKVAVSEVPLGVTVVQLTGPQPAVVRPSPLRAPLPVLLDAIQQMVGATRLPGPSISTVPETDPVAAGGEIQ